MQAFGKLPLEFASRATDMMAVSAHKIGGPVGVGALLVKPPMRTVVRLIPNGGGQEQNPSRRCTESAALIAGFGAATAAFPRYYDDARVAGMTASELEAGIAAILRRTRCFSPRAPSGWAMW